MSETPFIYSIYIKATPDHVWEALTENEFLRQFWGNIESDWQVGSSVREMSPENTVWWQGRVLQVERPHLLAFTMDGDKQQITITLQYKEPNTRLTLTHADIAPTEYEGTSEAWVEISSSLKSLIETEKAMFYPHWPQKS